MARWSTVLLLCALGAQVRGSPLGSPAAHKAKAPVGEPTSPARDFPPLRPLGSPVGFGGILPPPIGPASASTDSRTPSDAVRAEAGSYRLPEAIVPFSYSLFIVVDMEAAEFMGKTEIQVNVLTSTDTIVLHAGSNLVFEAKNMKVDRYNAWGTETVVEYVIKEVTRDSAKETVTIKLDKQLEKGKHYEIVFGSYTSKLNADLKGFYRSSYVEDGKTKYLAVTQFESTHARKAFPCFDEPSFKARFSMQFGHQGQYNVRANTPAIPTSETSKTLRMAKDFLVGDDNPAITNFDMTPPMSTYLVAWVVSEYTSVSDNNMAQPFSTWARKDIVTTGSSISQEVGPKALAELGKYTGITYRMFKTDQVAIPDFDAGAMENWGIVTYREPYLIKTESTNILTEQAIHTIICHELGHQWTGNLVTLDWWSHTWLNEGFATFFENFICDKIHPEMKFMDKMIPKYVHIGMDNDVIENQHAMSSNVDTPEEISGKFDRISYSKGGAVLRMFEWILTPEVFQKGIQRYLSNNLYANTNPQQLFHALHVEVVAAGVDSRLPQGVDFATVAESWTEQPGVPVVTVKWDKKAGEITFTQEQLKNADSKSTEKRGWYIPISFMTKEHAEFDQPPPIVDWLTPDEPSLTMPLAAFSTSDWVLVNPSHIGYYRVNYENVGWASLLVAFSNTEPDPDFPVVFPSTARSQVLDDAIALAQAGRLDANLVITFFDLLTPELDAVAWMSGLKVINTFSSHLANTEVYPAYKMLIEQSTRKSFESVGLTVKDTDDGEKRLLRYYVAPYACLAGNAQCLKEARDAVQAWINDFNNVKLAHQDVYDTALCFGVQVSDDKVFRDVKYMYAHTQKAEEKARLLKGLSCSLNKQLITSLLDEVLTKGASRDSAVALFNALIPNPDHHDLLSAYFKSNWKKIDEFFGDSNAQRPMLFQLLSAHIQTFTSPQDLLEFSNFIVSEFPAHHGYPAVVRAVTETSEKVNKWYDEHYASVSALVYYMAGVEPPTPGTTDAPNPTVPTKSPPVPPPTGSPVGPTSGPPGPGPAPGRTTTAKPPNAATSSVASSVLLACGAILASCIVRLQL